MRSSFATHSRAAWTEAWVPVCPPLGMCAQLWVVMFRSELTIFGWSASRHRLNSEREYMRRCWRGGPPSTPELPNVRWRSSLVEKPAEAEDLLPSAGGRVPGHLGTTTRVLR